MTHINADGKFQSDKYPTCPPGKVPLSVEDKSAQDLLWQYAQRRRSVDAEFANDLETCLRAAGYVPVDKPFLDVQDAICNHLAEMGEDAFATLACLMGRRDAHLQRIIEARNHTVTVSATSALRPTPAA